MRYGWLNLHRQRQRLRQRFLKKLIYDALESQVSYFLMQMQAGIPFPAFLACAPEAPCRDWNPDLRGAVSVMYPMLPNNSFVILWNHRQVFSATVVNRHEMKDEVILVVVVFVIVIEKRRIKYHEIWMDESTTTTTTTTIFKKTHL